MTPLTAIARAVARLRSHVRGPREQQPQPEGAVGGSEQFAIGIDDDAPADVAETEAGKIASLFADVVASEDLRELGDLLADDVVYLVPGRSGSAGVHRGHDAVLAALTQEVGANTFIAMTQVTELIAASNRAIVIVRFVGAIASEAFDYETAFHLRTVDGLVVAITEYSGDQYRADAIVADVRRTTAGGRQLRRPRSSS